MPETRPTLYLIDGSGYIFRAFLRAAADEYLAGLPTHAVLRLYSDAAEAAQRRAPVAYRNRFRLAQKNFPRRLVRQLQGQPQEAPNDLHRADSVYPSRGRSIQDQIA